jgi:hypothetical protein
MKRNAIRAALSDKAANGRILLMDQLTFDEPRTKAMEELLANLPLERHVLVLMPERDENVVLSTRNIRRAKLGHVASINVVELLKYDHVLMPVATVDRIVEMFGEAADDRLQMKRHPRVVLRKQARRERAAAAAAGTATPATTTSGATATRAKTAGARKAAPAAGATEAQTEKPAKPARGRAARTTEE